MQGRLIIFSILVAGLSPTAALAGETIKRLPCAKEQPQQAQQRQQAREQQPRTKRQGCPVVRSIPPVVDPTPLFLL
jgi:hypothetical protein